MRLDALVREWGLGARRAYRSFVVKLTMGAFALFFTSDGHADALIVGLVRSTLDRREQAVLLELILLARPSGGFVTIMRDN